jgi:hypothetical protein
MNIDNSYTQQAETFLSDASITFTVVLIGSDCPKFCEDARKGKDMDKVNVFPRKSHIHGKHYRVTFERTNGTSLVVEFWNSYADEDSKDKYKHPHRWNGKRPAPDKRGNNWNPTAYDVLACLTKSDPRTFEEFCGDMGLDTDSRRAEETWRAVMDEWVRVQRFFSADELGKLQEIN